MSNEKRAYNGCKANVTFRSFIVSLTCLWLFVYIDLPINGALSEKTLPP